MISAIWRKATHLVDRNTSVLKRRHHIHDCYLLVGFWHVCVDADVQRDKVQNGVYRFRFQNRRSNRTQCKGMLYEKPDLRRP